MSFIDKFKGNQFKKEIQLLNQEKNNLVEENESLRKELENLKNSFPPEIQNILELKKLIISLNNNKQSVINDIKLKTDELHNLNFEIQSLNETIDEKRKEILVLDDDIALQEFALYRPQYDFENSETFKQKILEIRNIQKDLIRNDRAATSNTNWTVNGSVAQGRKMINDEKKLLIRAFNNECDIVIDKVKFNTFDTAKKRIEKSCETITKLGKTNGISITPEYFRSKLVELHLVHEYRVKKQEEKEEQKEIRARLREEAKLQKEIEEARNKIKKEQLHYKMLYIK